MSLTPEREAFARDLVRRCKERRDAERAATIAAMDARKVLDLINTVLNRHVEDEHFSTQDWNEMDLVQGWIEALLQGVASWEP